jgi:hypothetical protein
MAKPKAWLPTAAEQSLLVQEPREGKAPNRGGMLRLFAVLNLRDLGQKFGANAGRRRLVLSAKHRMP